VKGFLCSRNIFATDSAFHFSWRYRGPCVSLLEQHFAQRYRLLERHLAQRYRLRLLERCLLRRVLQRFGLLVDDHPHVADALGAFGLASGVAEHMGRTRRALLDGLADIAFPYPVAIADIQSDLTPHSPTHPF
jgi:hypothetical protein